MTWRHRNFICMITAGRICRWQSGMNTGSSGLMPCITMTVLKSCSSTAGSASAAFPGNCTRSEPGACMWFRKAIPTGIKAKTACVFSISCFQKIYSGLRTSNFYTRPSSSISANPKFFPVRMTCAGICRTFWLVWNSLSEAKRIRCRRCISVPCSQTCCARYSGIPTIMSKFSLPHGMK